MKTLNKTAIKKKLDVLFSKIVRSVGRCERCGKTEHLQCAHIFSRRHLSLRYDFENAICLCAGCHLYWWHLEPAEAIRWVSKIKNMDYLEEQKNKITKLKDLVFLCDELKERAKNL